MTSLRPSSRRGFLVGCRRRRAVRSAFQFPSRRRRAQALPSLPEINAWVVIKPDDTVIIRIARAEMGQGTLTGLAQLVAEELECDWSQGDDGVSDARPERRPQPRVGQFLHRRGSRGIRDSHDYVRKGGAAARDDARAGCGLEMGRSGLRMQGRRRASSRTRPGAASTYGKLADAAAKLEPPKDIQLKDPKDWTIAGKPLKRLDTADKLDGKSGLLHRRQAAGHAERRDPRLPGLRRQGEELRRRQDRRHAGRASKVVHVGDSAVAVVADTWWQAKTALEALPIVWDEGRTPASPATPSTQMLKEGLDRRAGLRRQPGRRRQGRDRRRREDGRGDLQRSPTSTT